ncbi:FtsX-like permease family protein [Paenibacillus monticola]|uniref:FtsX-like permease family protein n=1 Tax=Paenibacillus monticola TaxID=2666075 RepID=A0A7X2L5C8_9BACL|nr:FtsX-like permease family protein [Paenibacillus monticola]MRN56376.1 FtsX-like permease family protein [Paenibacillus monticola]
MLKLLGSFWWRNKERFIVLLIGVFIVSSGLSFLSGLMESNKGTVMETLQNKWQVSYHILVRPPGTTLTDEQNQLIEPNLPGGISGGISTQQWNQIKQIAGVEVAAPLAVIGYSGYGLSLDGYTKVEEPGIYNSKLKVSIDNGMQLQNTEEYNVYGTYKFSLDKDMAQTYRIADYGTNNIFVDTVEYQSLLVGIDPVEENKLVGLNQALKPLDGETSRYFSASDKSTAKYNTQFQSKEISLPILVSRNVLPENATYTFETTRLDLPFSTPEEASAAITELGTAGVKSYLQKSPVDSKQSHSYSSEQVFEALVDNLFNQDMQFQGIRSFQLCTPMQFNPVSSPYMDRWPVAYQLQTHNLPQTAAVNDHAVSTYAAFTDQFPEYYRPLKKLMDTQSPDRIAQFQLLPEYIGMYDPANLQVTKDIGNLFPMDTYSTPTAKSVLNKNGQPVNPQVHLSSIHNPLGFMTSPPTMLTTLDAAGLIMGDAPISVIRVKVNGVVEITEANRAKLERVAATIRETTGLLADVTFASSPQPVLIQIPPSGTQTDLGWIEQQWIKLGTAFTLVSEVKVGFSGMLVLIMVVAVIYVAVTNLVSFLVRKQQFAVLLSIGWRYSQINRLIFTEAGLIGLVVALVTWSMESYFIFIGRRQIALSEFLAVGGFGFLIYSMGAIAPIILVRRISPVESLRSGETSVAVRRVTPVLHLFQLALAHFTGKLKRNSLSVVSMTIPATLLMFLVFVTLRLKGTFYTSWLGQYAAAEIGPMHYVAMIICLIISVLTIAEIMWQNVTERNAEVALLKALGWRKNMIRRLILWEGVIAGTLAGVLSLILGTLFITGIYGQFPGRELWVILPFALVPLMAGLAGSIIPAELAAGAGLRKGLAGRISASKLSTRLLKGALTIALLLMLALSAASVQRIMHPVDDSSASAVIPETDDTHLPEPVSGSAKIGDLSQFIPHPIANNNKAAYDLDLLMNEQGQFTVKAIIHITNTSSDHWDQLVFYMIPNIFTLPDEQYIYRKDARFKLNSVQINEKKASYTLNRDTLEIPLEDGLAPTADTKVEVSYTFTLPEKGIRFSRTGQSFDLAQWYPMLATYENGWNKQPYLLAIESYHTDFSDFTLHYKLPSKYRVISTSDLDPVESVSSGELKAKHVKEFMVSFTKDLSPIRQSVDNIEIKVWAGTEDKQYIENALKTAVGALHFFNQNIGAYPHKQLDIILGDRLSMEYPGIVAIFTQKDIRHVIVHEIAHQWFYGVVSNDTFHDGWLDEGMTELATSLYLKDYSFAESLYQPNRQYSNLPLSDYRNGEIGSSLYAQPTLKFKELFERQKDDNIGFLQVYFKTYQYKQVDTKEFIAFVKAYYGMEDHSFFDGWIK